MASASQRQLTAGHNGGRPSNHQQGRAGCAVDLRRCITRLFSDTAHTEAAHTGKQAPAQTHLLQHAAQQLLDCRHIPPAAAGGAVPVAALDLAGGRGGERELRGRGEVR